MISEENKYSHCLDVAAGIVIECIKADRNYPGTYEEMVNKIANALYKNWTETQR